MDERNVIDVTSFLLFESSGDSEEADSDFNITTNSLGQDSSMAEDDAQSCSDLVDPNELFNFDHDDEHDHGEEQSHVIDVNDDDDDDDGDNYHMVVDDDDENDEEWSSCGKLVLQKKSKVCADYSKMNERDKDRHFWETCLAS